MSFPPIMWLILALGVAWLLLRMLAGRAEDQRRAAHDERMAQLYAERQAFEERRRREAATDEHVDATAAAADETVKVRCRACKALNDESASACEKCGAEL